MPFDAAWRSVELEAHFAKWLGWVEKGRWWLGECFERLKKAFRKIEWLFQKVASALEGFFAPPPHHSSFSREASPHKKSNGPLPVDWDERHGFPHAQGSGELKTRDRLLDGGPPMLLTRWEGNRLLVEWEKAKPCLDVLRIVAIDCQLGRPESLPILRIHDERIHQKAGIFEIEVKALRVIVSIGRIEKGRFCSLVHAIAK